MESKQVSLLDEIDRKKVLEDSLEDFEKEMDRIKALPEKEWRKLFKLND